MTQGINGKRQVGDVERSFGIGFGHPNGMFHARWRVVEDKFDFVDIAKSFSAEIRMSEMGGRDAILLLGFLAERDFPAVRDAMSAMTGNCRSNP